MSLFRLACWLRTALFVALSLRTALAQDGGAVRGADRPGATGATTAQGASSAVDTPLLAAPSPFKAQFADPMLAPLPRAPQEVATWDEAIELLRRTSPDEAAARAGIERARGRWRQALGLLLPTLRLVGGVSFDALNPETPPGGSAVGGGRNPATVPLGTLTVTLNQALIDPAGWAGLGAARSAREGATASAHDLHRRLTLGLAQALVAVITAERVAELNRLGLQQAMERAALTARTQELGGATQLDAVRVQQDVEVARGILIAGDEQLRRTREALGLALGQTTEVGVPAGFALQGLAEALGEDCRPVAWDRRADLEAARANVESAHLSRRQAQAGYAPTVGLTSNLFGYTTDPGFGRFGVWNIGGALTLPLWEGGSREGLVRERAAIEEQAGAALHDLKTGVAIEVAQARRRVTVAQDLLGNAQHAHELASRLDALTRRSFEVGRGSSIELVQSAVALRQADTALTAREFDLVQARLDALLTEASCGW